MKFLNLWWFKAAKVRSSKWKVKVVKIITIRIIIFHILHLCHKMKTVKNEMIAQQDCRTKDTSLDKN